MAVVIRLARVGAVNKPRYRVVVADSKFPKEGRKLEILGSYDPFNKEKGFIVKSDKIAEWIKKGAKPTNTVNKLLKKVKV